jgi:hypothetical protein
MLGAIEPIGFVSLSKLLVSVFVSIFAHAYFIIGLWAILKARR